jgi:hypothetical protein
MSDYIGFYGCIFLVQFLDVFIRLLSVLLPLAVALLRYLLIVKHTWVRSVGITRCKYKIFKGPYNSVNLHGFAEVVFSAMKLF